MIAEKITATQGISVAIRAPSLPHGEISREVGPHQGAVAAPPDPGVPVKPAQGRCTADGKLRILRLADACTEPGSPGALLWREGLFYTSNLTAWHWQRDAGTLSVLTLQKWGRKEKGRDLLLLGDYNTPQGERAVDQAPQTGNAG